MTRPSNYTGVDLTKVSSTPDFTLGMTIDVAGTFYQYVKSAAALTQYLWYGIHPNTFVCGTAATHAAFGSGSIPRGVGVPQNADFTAANLFGWVAVGGKSFTGKANGQIAVDSKIYTTATAGEVDDASTTQTLIAGGTQAVSAIAAAGNFAFTSVEVMRVNCAA